MVVVDESQDFSANQVRAILNHLADDHTITFVMDAAQRVYPQGFNWRDVGITALRDSTKGIFASASRRLTSETQPPPSG